MCVAVDFDLGGFVAKLWHGKLWFTKYVNNNKQQYYISLFIDHKKKLAVYIPGAELEFSLLVKSKHML